MSNIDHFTNKNIITRRKALGLISKGGIVTSLGAPALLSTDSYTFSHELLDLDFLQEVIGGTLVTIGANFVRVPHIWTRLGGVSLILAGKYLVIDSKEGRSRVGLSDEIRDGIHEMRRLLVSKYIGIPSEQELRKRYEQICSLSSFDKDCAEIAFADILAAAKKESRRTWRRVLPVGIHS